jgi:glycosyl hydrolase family 5
MPPALQVEGGRFLDPLGREVILRGINVSGDSKLPTSPLLPSHEENRFFDGDSVSFVGRPFSIASAPEHFARLRSWGYDVLRYIYTWEAIEHEGPGRYDDEFIEHTVSVLRLAGEYGFKVFLDPHQDVWSRFTGGSGAPMWTLYACGFDPQTFVDNEAAIVHNTWPGDKHDIPKMIWTTNYFRLACQTIFALFMAGKTFAPKCIIDGKNIQDYLQDHFVAACKHLLLRIKEAGDLLGEVVVGCESMNEPNKGFIGWQDLSAVPRDQRLRRGTSPTPWQSMLLAAGVPQECEVWDIKWNGPAKTGSQMVNEKKVSAWLPFDVDDIRYGWKRDPGWKLGECIWAQHGVWDPKKQELLKKDYFSKDPENGKVIDFEYFTNKWFMNMFRKYRDAIRSVYPASIIIIQGPTLEIPPTLKGTPDEDSNMASGLHWYDGMTLLFKKWNSWYTMDIIGMMRGKYPQEWMAIKFGGAKVIKNCFRDQFNFMKNEAQQRLGNIPVLFTETGSPYDLSDKAAYETHDFSDQIASLDSVHFALEKSGIHGYMLWDYTENNTHDWGDQWNNEDFSIYSIDDPTLPLKSPGATPRRRDSNSLRQILSRNSSNTLSRVPSRTLSRTPSNTSSRAPSRTTSRTPTIDLSMSSLSLAEDGKKKYRAGEAHIRPWPIAVCGKVLSFEFDMAKQKFSLEIEGDSVDETAEPNCSEIYIPEFYYPKAEMEVDVSSGRYDLCLDKDMRKLQWFHEGGKQYITINRAKST